MDCHARKIQSNSDFSKYIPKTRPDKARYDIKLSLRPKILSHQ